MVQVENGLNSGNRESLSPVQKAAEILGRPLLETIQIIGTLPLSTIEVLVRGRLKGQREDSSIIPPQQ